MPIVLSLLLTMTLVAAVDTPAQAGQSPAPPPRLEQKVDPPAGPVPVTPGVAIPDTYVIGKQDQLGITVFEDDTVKGSYAVDMDGAITFPYINRIIAAGLTVRQ